MKVGLFDIRILSMGVKNGGRVDDAVLGRLEQVGTGRVMDSLASMAERGLISLNDDRTFQVTDAARQILWSDGVPLRIRVLRILESGSMDTDKIAEYLDADAGEIGAAVEDLRKNRMVLMSTQVTGDGPGRVFEILPEGKEELEWSVKRGFDGTSRTPKKAPGEVYVLLGEIAEMLGSADMDEKVKHDILERISAIQSRLDI